MAIQRFYYKNEGDGYTALTIREADKCYYVCERHEPAVDAALVSKEIFDILKTGISVSGYTVSGGDKLLELDDKYVLAVFRCIVSGKAEVPDIMNFCEVSFSSAVSIVIWMVDMGYISAENDSGYKVCVDLNDFMAKYGNLEF